MRARRPLLWRVRRRLRYWPVTLCLALIAGTATALALADAESAGRSFGERRRVAVAVRDLPVGHVIEDGDVEWRELPALVATHAVDTETVGRVVTQPVLASEPIVDARLAPTGASGADALVPAGRRGVAVPALGVHPPLELGDRVDVLTAPPLTGSRAETVTRDALVVAVDEQAVTVAVEERDVPRVGLAVLDGTAVIALAPP